MDKFIGETGLTYLWSKIKAVFATKQDVSNKQDALVSGTNIKTINNTSLLGSGNIAVLDEAAFIYTIDASSVVDYGVDTTVSDTQAYIDIHDAIEDGKAVYIKWDDGWGDFYPILPLTSELGYGNYPYDFTISIVMNGNAVSFDAKIGSNNVVLRMEYTSLNSTPVVSHGTSDTTYSVIPNTLHIWSTVASLTLTLATPTDATIVNEYMIEFKSGSTATTLSLPATVKWAESCGILLVEANKTYQISIVNNIGLWTSISNS